MKRKTFLILLMLVVSGVVLLLAAQPGPQEATAVQKVAAAPQAVTVQPPFDPCTNCTTCVIKTPETGKEVYCQPTRDIRWANYCLNLNLDMQLFGRDIIAYRIRWFTGGWSTWYFPGVNDLYKKANEPLRRQWACFNDHEFMYLYNQF